jgi:tetratricopeptide (TPR) repeat protein
MIVYKYFFFSESLLGDHFYLVPNAYFELALLHIDRKLYDDAKKCLEKAREFKNYPLQTRLHFRLHRALEILGHQSPTN